MRAGYLIVAAAIAAVLLAGCGSGSPMSEEHPERLRKPTELRVTLDGPDRPETAGILMAERLGYFEEANLRVVAFKPATPSRPVEYVADGTDDIGISHEPQVVLAQEKGVPIVALGSLISQPTLAMIWLDRSAIHDIADLKGKVIAIPGLSFQEQFLKSFLARGGLTLDDVKVKRVWYNLVPRLVEGRVDAIFGGDWNAEGTQLEARGLHPVITRVQSLGFPSYDELVVIVRSDRLAADPRVYRVFMSAVARGTAAAIEHPEEMAEVLEDDVNANPDRSKKATEAEVKATLPMLGGIEPISSDQATKLMDWMREEGMIRQTWPASKLFDNEYLPPS